MRPRELHRAGEPHPRRAQPVPGATGVQDGTVELGVVGGDERRVADPGAERRPELGEVGRVLHVLPAEPVNVGEREPRAGRTNQVRSRQHDSATAASREPDGARAVAAGGGGFEVDRDEGGIVQDDGCRTDESVTRTWAKSPNRAGGTGSGWLTLIDHSIDVAAVAEALLSLSTIKKRLGALAERELSSVDLARLCFLIGLHDAGKVNQGFQRKLQREPRQAGHIGPLWAAIGGRPVSERERRLLSRIRTAMKVPAAWFEDRWAEQQTWGAILAHHGSLPQIHDVRIEPSLWNATSDYDPVASLSELAETMRRMMPEAFTDGHPEPLPVEPRFQHAFAGLVTLADWIGSDDTVFRVPNAGAPTGPDRVPWARKEAKRVLRRYGIDPAEARSAATAATADFKSLFPARAAPRPAQRAFLDGPPAKPGQITILEAETGSGKTEAALIHFVRLFRAGAVDGLYFALPTRAAAVQIHGRVKDFMQQWLGDAAPPVGLAVPGYLRVDDAVGERLPHGYRVLWPDEAEGRGWAVENTKRYLSGAVMVGTIDQVLLGGLRVRYAPFRSGPMLRLLLCIDEVHASDAYMTELLRNTLQQHRAAGGHALLMSATLGSLARLRLLRERVEEHEAPDPETATELPYPSIQRSGEEPQRLSVDTSQGKTVTTELVDPAIEATDLLHRMQAAAEVGAVVLFVRNRVDDAVATVRQLEAMDARIWQCRGVTAPHHSRFAAEDRRLLDRALDEAFRTREGVVAVTTQTAEQSLDIDADWLVTDLAPGDVLLQRIGRLHRHEQARPRPDGFSTARVTILAPTPEQMAGTLNPRDGESARPHHAWLGQGVREPSRGDRHAGMAGQAGHHRHPGEQPRPGRGGNAPHGAPAQGREAGATVAGAPADGRRPDDGTHRRGPHGRRQVDRTVGRHAPDRRPAPEDPARSERSPSRTAGTPARTVRRTDPDPDDPRLDGAFRRP